MRSFKATIAVYAVLTLMCGLVAAAGLYFGSFFGWITANPPLIDPATGVTRSHTAAELERARTLANFWLAVFTLSLIAFLLRFGDGYDMSRNPERPN
jgi:hypothetical protein